MLALKPSLGRVPSGILSPGDLTCLVSSPSGCLASHGSELSSLDLCSLLPPLPGSRPAGPSCASLPYRCALRMGTPQPPWCWHLDPLRTWHQVTATPPIHPATSILGAVGGRHLQWPLPSLWAHSRELPLQCGPWAPSLPPHTPEALLLALVVT